MDHAFAVIGDHDSVALGGLAQNELAQTISRRVSERLAVFPIQSDNLLVSRTGDDPALLDSREPGISRHSGGGNTDLLQPLKQNPPCGIPADDTAGGDAPA